MHEPAAHGVFLVHHGGRAGTRSEDGHSRWVVVRGVFETELAPPGGRWPVLARVRAWESTPGNFKSRGNQRYTNYTQGATHGLIPRHGHRLIRHDLMMPAFLGPPRGSKYRRLSGGGVWEGSGRSNSALGPGRSVGVTPPSLSALRRVRLTAAAHGSARTACSPSRPGEFVLRCASVPWLP